MFILAHKGWLLFLSILITGKVFAQETVDREKIEWNNTLSLPPVDSHTPVNVGVAGAFSGFIDSTLIIAGGANFPDGPPWQGGHKTWWKTMYSMNPFSSSPEWNILQPIFPTPLAYGVTIQLPQGLLCIGGCDSTRCYKDVFLIQLKNNRISIDKNWPPLPTPLANSTGTFINNKVYIAGGQENMSAPQATGHFYMLDLMNLSKGWTKLASWPGEPRGYAVSAVQSDGFDKCFYLFSGRNYDPSGRMKVLTDGYTYNPRLNQWKKLKQQFQETGADAIAAIAPNFFKPVRIKDLVDFFVPVAGSAAELSFYYYNMPSMTGICLPVNLFLQEGKKVILNLAGTKFTHNNLMEMGECLALNDGEFEVLHGYDEILISGLVLGAVAAVGSTYNYFPSVYLGILDAMEKGDLATARKLQMKSIELVEVIIKYGGGVRGGKAIMNLIGIECGQCRLPITPFSDKEYLELKEDLDKIGFLSH